MKRDYNRIKKIIAGATVLGVAAVGLGAMEQEPPRMQTIEYVVKPNDTLWNIAAEYTDDSEDIREVIADIKEGNNLERGYVLQPGQRLVIKKEMPDTPMSDIPVSQRR